MNFSLLTSTWLKICSLCIKLTPRFKSTWFHNLKIQFSAPIINKESFKMAFFTESLLKTSNKVQMICVHLLMFPDLDRWSYCTSQTGAAALGAFCQRHPSTSSVSLKRRPIAGCLWRALGNTFGLLILNITLFCLHIAMALTIQVLPLTTGSTQPS